LFEGWRRDKLKRKVLVVIFSLFLIYNNTRVFGFNWLRGFVESLESKRMIMILLKMKLTYKRN
jgi:hypothetical protein